MLELRGYFLMCPPLKRRQETERSWIFLVQLWDSWQNYSFKQLLQRLHCISRNAIKKKKTPCRTRFMPHVPFIPVRRIVMAWIWSFSCDVSMKDILKLVWLFFGGGFVYLFVYFILLTTMCIGYIHHVILIFYSSIR